MDGLNTNSYKPRMEKTLSEFMPMHLLNYFRKRKSNNGFLFKKDETKN